MNIIVLKVLLTLATLVIAIVGIFASYKLRKFTKWFDILSAFSGGILIATAYTHMLPEAMETYDMYMTSHASSGTGLGGVGNNAAVPKAKYQENDDGVELVIADGEPGTTGNTTSSNSHTQRNRVANSPRGGHDHDHDHDHHHHSHDHDHDHDHQHHHDHDHSHDHHHSHDHRHDHHQKNVVKAAALHDHDHSHEDHYYPLIPFLAAMSFLVLFLVERGAILYMQDKANHKKHVDCSDIEMVKVDGGSCHGECGAESASSTHGEACHEQHSAPNCCKDIKSLEKMSEVAAFALIIAVSLHAVVEGMGMGAQNQEPLVVSSFVGIAVHKGLEGFAVGANLLEANVTKKKFIMYSAVVCLASPLGALVGYLLTLGGQSGEAGITGAILGALAVGTFIQVATMEFLPRTFAKPEYFTLKALALLIGFGAMSTMPIWNEHAHVH
jgi:zinc transporter ZupT